MVQQDPGSLDELPKTEPHSPPHLYGLDCHCVSTVSSLWYTGTPRWERRLGDCKRLFSAGIQLASPPDLNACRVRVCQSHEWACPKPSPGLRTPAVPFQRSRGSVTGDCSSSTTHCQATASLPAPASFLVNISLAALKVPPACGVRASSPLQTPSSKRQELNRTRVLMPASTRV